MCAAVATPALALGPPGWIIFGAAVVGTALVTAAVSMSSSPSTTKTVPRSTTRDRTCTECPASRPWSVRVHAQGTMIGGRSGSTIGAPPLVKGVPVTAAEGVGLASATYGLLTRSQERNLSTAYERCTRFITSRPPAGFLGKRSFYGLSRDNNRFDVDSFGVTPNFVT